MVRKQDNVAKLGDMMLAKALEGIKAKQITKPGELVGDLSYMAPERTKSDVEVDTRADIYWLDATLYALLTGKPPFQAKTLVETIAQIRQSDPVPPKKFQLSIPDQFQDVVMMMLAKGPELRYQTPAEVVRHGTSCQVSGCRPLNGFKMLRRVSRYWIMVPGAAASKDSPRRHQRRGSLPDVSLCCAGKN